MKSQPIYRRKICTNDICDKGLISKELIKLNCKKNTLKFHQKWVGQPNSSFSKEHIQMTKVFNINDYVKSKPQTN